MTAAAALHKRAQRVPRCPPRLTMRILMFILLLPPSLLVAWMIYLANLDDASQSPVTKLFGDYTADDGVTPQNLRNHYLRKNGGLVEENENPVCGLGGMYDLMHWSNADVRRATKEYLRENTQMLVMTSSRDGYSRVAAAECTWMAHVPTETLLFVTDKPLSEMPGEHGVGPQNVYSLGLWKPGTSAEEAATRYNRHRAELGEAVQHNKSHSEWLAGQLRFFDAVHFAIEAQHHTRMGANWYRRWVMILDDDSYVHLDSLVATLQYHSVTQLLESNDYWWSIFSARMLAGSHSEPERTQKLREAEETSRAAWMKQCEMIVLMGSLQYSWFQREAVIMRQEDCDALPGKIADAAQFALDAVGNHTSSDDLSCILEGQIERACLTDRIARILSNVLFFLEDDTPSDSVYWKLWLAMEDLLKPPWVHAFVLKPTLMRSNVLAGQGIYFNAPLLYTRFLKQTVSQVGGSKHVMPGIDAICVHENLFSGNYNAHDSIRHCTEQLGGELVDEGRFTDKIANDLIAENELLVHVPSPTGQVSGIGAKEAAALIRPDLIRWATGHVKMEFDNATRHYARTRQDLPQASSERLAALRRLAPFRMRLYYEAIYLRNARSAAYLKVLGAQCRNEMHETDKHRAVVRDALEKVFYPAFMSSNAM